MTKVNSIDPELEQYVGKAARNSSKRAVKEKPAAIKEKFVEARLAKVVEIKAMTENQSKALQLMKKSQVVILRGSSGSGKSFLACSTAANEYLKGNFEKIVLIRPYEQLSRSIGLRPGTGDQKLLPLMQSMLQTLEKVFGKAELAAKIAEGTVVLEALEDVRGRSYGKSFVIVDEGSNVDTHAMKALLTRLEDTSKLVICGDDRQKDTKSAGGLNWVCELMERIRKNPPNYLSQEDVNQAHNNFGVVTFTNQDIVRGGFTSLMVKLFDGENV